MPYPVLNRTPNSKTEPDARQQFVRLIRNVSYQAQQEVEQKRELWQEWLISPQAIRTAQQTMFN